MRSVQQNRHECYEPNMSTSAILDFPNVTLYIVKWNVPFANNAHCGLTTFPTFPTVATPSTCSHLAWFEFKMNSDSDREELFKILTACTTVTKDVLEFSRGLEKKYANEKQFFCTLPLRGHIGLLTDKMAMSLVPEDLPLEPEIAATRTSPDGNCLFNAVSLALVGDETQMSLLRLLVAVELLLNCEFCIQHQRFTSFSSALRHLCLINYLPLLSGCADTSLQS